jgi:hypothetical protein
LAFSQNIIEINNDKITSNFYENLQKTLEMYKLDNIQNSNEKIIRSWKGKEIYSLKEISDYQQIFKNEINDSIYVYKNTLKEKIVDLNIEQIKNLEVFYPIDCFPIAFEIVEHNNYFVKVIGCNKDIKSIISNIFNRVINNDIQNFIQNLPSGEYQNSMIIFTINQPIKRDSDKTNFYKKLETELRDKNIEINDPKKQPLILINSETLYFEDINKIEESKIKSYKILDKEQRNLYGTRGEFGVILIETN